MIWKRINENLDRQRQAEKAEKPEERLEEMEKLGAKDIFAMLISAFVTIFLPCLLVLAGLCTLVMLIFGLF